MRPTLVLGFVALSITVMIEPLGPWTSAPLPPAAAWAPSTVEVGPDTFRLVGDAWRDAMPQVVATCGGTARDPHRLRLIVQMPAVGGLPATPPALDSLWVAAGSRSYVDASPRWDASYGWPRIRYEGLLGFAVGDTVTIVVSSSVLPGKARYLATRTVVIATM